MICIWMLQWNQFPICSSYSVQTAPNKLFTERFAEFPYLSLCISYREREFRETLGHVPNSADLQLESFLKQLRVDKALIRLFGAWNLSKLSKCWLLCKLCKSKNHLTVSWEIQSLKLKHWFLKFFAFKVSIIRFIRFFVEKSKKFFQEL